MFATDVAAKPYTAMNKTEKTIFDALAAGGGINLPGIGSLRTEQCAAEFISAKSLLPPHSRIVFSMEANPAYPTIARDEEYLRWLEHAVHTDGVVEINGVGVLREGIFYPSVELHDTINPQGAQPIDVKRHHGTRDRFLVGAAVIAGAALIMTIVIAINEFVMGRDTAGPAPEYVAETEETIAASRGESTIAPSAAEEAFEEVAEEFDTASAAEETVSEAAAATDIAPEDAIQQQLENYAAMTSAPSETAPATPSATVYHLVVGVFSTPSNADRMIREDALGIGSANYTKADFGNGRTLVSACSSTDRKTVEARKRELAGRNSDLWIYTSRAK